MRFVRDFMEENMEQTYTGKIHLLSYNEWFVVSIFLYQFDDDDMLFDEVDIDELTSDYIDQLGFLKKYKKCLSNFNKLNFDFF